VSSALPHSSLAPQSRHPARGRLVFALDYPSLELARRGAAQVSAAAGVVKVGLELFVRHGPPAVSLGTEVGTDVFLDLKLHDIPETVDRAVASACGLGVKYLTIHAAGGPKMVERAAARAARDGTGLKVLAVTVLTSLDAVDLRAVGVDSSPGEQAARLARLAIGAGADGLVCSAQEVSALRAAVGTGPVLVTPGIRPAQSSDDQKRVATPEQAIARGASLLVVGRPIRDAADPAAAARAIADAIEAALPAVDGS
jgi:orotidine-5'-phosphate decarboxylase